MGRPRVGLRLRVTRRGGRGRVGRRSRGRRRRRCSPAAGWSLRGPRRMGDDIAAVVRVPAAARPVAAPSGCLAMASALRLRPPVRDGPSRGCDRTADRPSRRSRMLGRDGRGIRGLRALGPRGLIAADERELESRYVPEAQSAKHKGDEPQPYQSSNYLTGQPQRPRARRAGRSEHRLLPLGLRAGRRRRRRPNWGVDRVCE
jgi:hypothetical protein